MAELSFWAGPADRRAGVGRCVGLLFGLPVLRVRGDYLALATLGLGEIIRVLVLSDMRTAVPRRFAGHPAIPRPEIGAYVLEHAGRAVLPRARASAVAAYVPLRLRSSWAARLAGRSRGRGGGAGPRHRPRAVKLLAYTIGAAFAGLAGAVFAVRCWARSTRTPSSC